ncbi:hypothetical protein E1A91_D01G166600v1 [Gossypium mustelinum]|uniref:Uncharacterized protein n=2 Tax=Gossypium TaxID=3633 RepID=A0A5D2W816_GOSMU|nr:hypothetical protein ES288_D01G173200v1 [Gossypium darwinii]TYI97772.1 hypothetical protein E1A91_D01G166600v1 [Gossypium mustelinum]
MVVSTGYSYNRNNPPPLPPSMPILQLLTHPMKYSSQQPPTKIGFSRFNGGDPSSYILKAEKHYRYCQTPNYLKVDVATMYLVGDALGFFA